MGMPGQEQNLKDRTTVASTSAHDVPVEIYGIIYIYNPVDPVKLGIQLVDNADAAANAAGGTTLEPTTESNADVVTGSAETSGGNAATGSEASAPAADAAAADGAADAASNGDESATPPAGAPPADAAAAPATPGEPPVPADDGTAPAAPAAGGGGS